MNPITKVTGALAAIARHPLSRQNKLKAVLRYGFVQVAARLVPGDVCVEFPNKTCLLVSPKMKGAAHYIMPRLCEFNEMAFVMHFLRPGRTFADVGANIGAFTVLAAGVARAQVVAFEASPDTVQMLARNVRLNGLQDRVKIVHAAAGKNEGTVQFSVGLGTENRVNLQKEGNGSVTVKMTTLDVELAQTPPNLLKVDVEGFETQVFAGAGKILTDSKLQAIIVERSGLGSGYGFDEVALHQEIRRQGFVACNYEPFARQLFEVGENVRGNIIYIRNLTAAGELVRTAPAFTLDHLTV